jgi:hypothetical protein
MTGYNTVLKLRNFEAKIETMGFRMAYPKYGHREYDAIALYPKDEAALPVYRKDAELFIGTIEQAEDWIAGIEWARQYDMFLGVSNEKRRARKEQDRRNANLLNTLKSTGEFQTAEEQ